MAALSRSLFHFIVAAVIEAGCGHRTELEITGHAVSLTTERFNHSSASDHVEEVYGVTHARRKRLEAFDHTSDIHSGRGADIEAWNREVPQDVPELEVLWKLFALGLVAACIATAILQKLKRLPICRSIPFAVSFAFALSLVGLATSVTAVERVVQALEVMGATTAKRAVRSATISFSGMLIINIIALSLGVMGAGCLRECILRRRSVTFAGKATQCLLGPLVFGIVQVLLWGTLVLQLLLSHTALVAGVIIWEASGICFVGHAAADQAQDLVRQFIAAKGLDHGFDLVHYCNHAEKIGQAGLCFTLGCVLTVLSQAAMISAMSAEQAKIEDEIARAAEVEDNEIANESRALDARKTVDSVPQESRRTAVGSKDQDTLLERVITFPPGRLGLKMNWSSMKVVEVPNGNARNLGVQVGWTLKDIDGAPYSEELLEKRIAGDKPYNVTFLQENLSRGLSATALAQIVRATKKAGARSRSTSISRFKSKLALDDEQHQTLQNELEDMFRWKWAESEGLVSSQWSMWKSSSKTISDMLGAKDAKEKNRVRAVAVQLRVSSEETAGYDTIDVAVEMLQKMEAPIEEIESDINAAEADTGATTGVEDDLMRMHIQNEKLIEKKKKNSDLKAKLAESKNIFRWKWVESQGFYGSRWSFWRASTATISDLDEQQKAKQKNIQRQLVVQVSGDVEETFVYENIAAALAGIEKICSSPAAEQPIRKSTSSAARLSSRQSASSVARR